ncbi:MAG: thioredoxin family protein [Bacteroidota bacterium]|nr:thioredoxin family protein [Bacteroidota bacterium]
MSVILTEDSNFQKEISTNEKVVVKYYADWCGSCKLFSPKFKRLSDDERFKGIIFLDVNAEKNPTARKAASVDTLPFFAIFKNGELIDKVSTSKEDVFISLLEKL